MLISLTLLISIGAGSATSAELSTISVSRSQSMIIKAYSEIRKSNFDNAIDILNKSLKVDPKNIEAHRYLAFSYLHNGRVAEALKEAEEVIHEGIELPHDAATMGEAHFYDGKPKKAIEFYREALLLNPLHIDARAGVIRCLMALGRFQEAKMICRQAAAGYQGAEGKTYFRKLLREIDSKTQVAATHFGS